MLLVKAGNAVDEFIEALLPHLEPGDVIIDGRQLTFPGHDSPDTISGVEGTALHRHGRVGRRRGRTARAVDHAGRIRCRVAARERDLPGDCREDARRRAMLRLGRRGWRRPLRQDGAQRDRVRRHAAHRRGLSPHEGRARLVERGDARGVRPVERRAARHVPDRNHARYSRHDR